MLGSSLTFPRRALVGASIAAAVSVSAAGAATYHRFAVTSATGSEGATAFLQGTPSGGALQGEVASSANTAIKIPFGMLGEFDPSGSPSPFGVGVIGISATGYAVAGESLAPQPSVLGYAGGYGAGVEGVAPDNSGVYGESKYQDGGDFVSDADGDGLFARSLGSGNAAFASAQGTGDGLLAESTSKFGVEVNNPATASDGVHAATFNGGASGVVGINNSTGTGTFGVSVGGYGLAGSDIAPASPSPSAPPATYAGTASMSLNGPGVYGVDTHNTGTSVGTGQPGTPASDLPAARFAGVLGYGNDGVGLYGYSAADAGAIVENSNANPTLFVNSDSSAGYEFAAASGPISSSIANFSIDHAGNVVHSGTINSISRNPQNDVATYSAQQTESTVEDLGSAQLIDGAASVRIADDFRSTTDGSPRYMVFLTPYGDNGGLYIASRNASGFIVRESRGGHDSLAFDYRVVAHPYASTRDERLPHLGRRMRVLGEHPASTRGSAASQAAGALHLPRVTRSTSHKSHETAPVSHDLFGKNLLAR